MTNYIIITLCCTSKIFVQSMIRMNSSIYKEHIYIMSYMKLFSFLSGFRHAICDGRHCIDTYFGDDFSSYEWFLGHICEKFSFLKYFIWMFYEICYNFITVVLILDETKFCLIILIDRFKDVVKIRIWERFIRIKLFNYLIG